MKEGGLVSLKVMEGVVLSPPSKATGQGDGVHSVTQEVSDAQGVGGDHPLVLHHRLGDTPEILEILLGGF